MFAHVGPNAGGDVVHTHTVVYGEDVSRLSDDALFGEAIDAARRALDRGNAELEAERASVEELGRFLADAAAAAVTELS